MVKDDLISAACKAGDDGLYVFPIKVYPDPEHEGKFKKEPLCKWRDLSSCEEDEIAKLPWKNATHFGIDCEKSGIWVVDVDDRAALSRCPLKQTRMQETIRGGMHFIYRRLSFDQRNTTGAPTAGIDIRANGGFIAWYGIGEMLNDPIELWPWENPIVDGAKKAGFKGCWEPKTVHENGRNNDLISACGMFMNLTPNATLAQVVPFAIGHSAMYHLPPLSHDECRTVAISSMRWRREDSTENDLGYFGTFDGLPRKEPPAKICGDWLRAGSYSICHARAGLGKTAFSAELVWCIKNELPFFGMPCTDPGEVLWLNGDLPDWQVNERLGFLNGMANLWHIEQVNLFPHIDVLLERCAKHKLVIMDNRPALFYLSDSNNAEIWHPLNLLMRQICSTGAAALLMTHSGKPGIGQASSSFGSSAQEWVADNIIELRSPFEKELKDYKGYSKQPTRLATWTKSRLCAPPPDRLFYFTEKLLERRLICHWKDFLNDA